MPRRLSVIAVIIVLTAVAGPAAAQTAQERLWDGAMQGDTLAMAGALKDGAVIDSLDIRRNPNGRRALNWAAWYDKPDAIRFLVAHGAQLNLANKTGFTPLHHAAENGSLAAARALVAAGASPAVDTQRGQDPLEVAWTREQVAVAALLDSLP